MVRKQLKKQFPNWNSLTRKEKKEIAKKVLSEFDDELLDDRIINRLLANEGYRARSSVEQKDKKKPANCFQLRV